MKYKFKKSYIKDDVKKCKLLHSLYKTRAKKSLILEMCTKAG